MKRPKYPKKADVLIVFDHPTKDELSKDEPFTSISNMNFLTSLRTGRASVYNKAPVPGWEGIKSKDFELTYLDYSYFGNIEENNDYKLEVSKTQIAGYVEFRPNIYISRRLEEELRLFNKLVEDVDPKLVIITGKWALYFTSPEIKLSETASYTRPKPLGALQRYRGSLLIRDNRIWFPIYHTLNIITIPDSQPIVEMDLQKLGDIFHTVKANGIDEYRLNHIYHIGDDAITYIENLLGKLNNGEKLTLSVDLETMFYKTPGQSIIDCIGIAHSAKEGGCIALAMPGMASLHSLTREQEIMGTLYSVLTHPNASIIGQNVIAFDIMVLLGRYLFAPKVKHDTLLLQHIMYSFLPKDLAFLASMYCKSSSYWKGEIVGNTRWIYNVKDAIYTYEVCEAQLEHLESEDKSLKSLYRHTVDKLVPATIATMSRGVRVNLDRKTELFNYFTELAGQVRQSLYDALGFEFNLNSGKQKKKILEEFFQIHLEMKRRKGKEAVTTMDAAAMLKYMDLYPMLRPFLALLLEYTAIVKFANTFLGAELDPDNRLRTQYKVAGTVTGRLASSKNAFGRACNLQNIPKKGKLELAYATDLSEDLDSQYIVYSPEGSIQLPNIKKIFIPDKGMELMDSDMSGADAMVVAWDSNCRFLIDFFTRREGKLYAFIASEHLQREVTSSSPEYKVYKAICHGCVTGEHEVLTPNGWIRIDEFNETTQELAVWDKDTKNIWFEKPKDFTRSFVDSDEDLVCIQGDSLSFLGTSNHRIPYLKSSGVIGETTAGKLHLSARIPYSGYYVGGTEAVDPLLARLIVALQADGTVNHTNQDGISTIRFPFRKQRKIDRLKFLLTELGIKFTVKTHKIPDTDYVDTYIAFQHKTLAKFKYLNWDILKWDLSSLQVFVEELQFWDGSVSGARTHVMTTNPLAAVIISTIIHLVGKASKTVVNEKAGLENSNPLYSVSINNRNYYRLENGLINQSYRHNGTNVYCPTTSTGFFLIRHNGLISVTGNSNYGMGLDKLALTLGIDLTSAKRLQNWYFTKCPEIPLWHKKIQEKIAKQGFITNVFGRKAYFVDKTDVTRYNKAYGFIGQSTVADAMNIAWPRVAAIPHVQVLMQVHDSLVTQYPIEIASDIRPKIISAMEVEIPYASKLVIPVDFKTSTASYGDV